MDEYSFLKSLKDVPTKTDNSPKIQYQEFYVNLEEGEFRLLIPLRETSNFEKELSATEISTKTEMLKILRKYRGIRG